jgi:hypothetical protein
MTVDLDKLEAAAKAATPGEWQFHATGCIRVCIDDFCVPIADMRAPYRKLVGIVRGYKEEQRNGEFIALANPAAILELVKRVRKAEDTAEGLESDLDSALDILRRRGDAEAQEWLRLNYPSGKAMPRKGLNQ